ncbi:hypothetical protein [Burkholderia anthina]|uniref:hypothetical protein n=1 Tax=Burkholderia anthina TaxID=179879 RepID=UPI0037BE6561
MQFENFYADMGDRPIGMTLERINNQGNYEPGNCEWASRHKQANNRARCRFVTAFGETKSGADWVRDSRCVVTRDTLFYRLDIGMSAEQAMTIPSTRKGPQLARRKLCPSD